MKRLALAVVALASPGLAHAGHTCGGGGGHGGGGGSAPSSSSSSSYSSGTSWSYSGRSTTGVAYEQPTGCIDDTDVLGYRKCTKYGEWAGNMRLPKLFIEVGSSVRQFASGLPDQQGQVTHGDHSFSYRVVMPTGTAAATPIDTAMTSTLRIGAVSKHAFYLAAEGELGGLTSTAQASTEMMSVGPLGGPQLAQQGALVLGAYGVAGVRGSVGGATLAIEAAGGVRQTRYHFDSQYYSCDTTSTIAVTRGIVEARARGEMWLGPWMTLGATIGANVAAKGDWLAGLYLGLHSRAFDGAR